MNCISILPITSLFSETQYASGSQTIIAVLSVNPANKDIDSYVSFGNYYDPSNPDKIDFVNGREPAILLEFNCDGPMFEKI